MHCASNLKASALGIALTLEARIPLRAAPECQMQFRTSMPEQTFFGRYAQVFGVG